MFKIKIMWKYYQVISEKQNIIKKKYLLHTYVPNILQLYVIGSEI